MVFQKAYDCVYILIQPFLVFINILVFVPIRILTVLAHLENFQVGIQAVGLIMFLLICQLLVLWNFHGILQTFTTVGRLYTQVTPNLKLGIIFISGRIREVVNGIIYITTSSQKFSMEIGSFFFIFLFILTIVSNCNCKI